MKKLRRKPTKQEIEAQEAHARLVAKWAKVPKFARQEHKADDYGKSPVVAQGSVIRKADTKHIPSATTHTGVGAKVADKRYTGDKVLGVALMHKSNYAPVFKDNAEAAVEIAQMRR